MLKGGQFKQAAALWPSRRWGIALAKENNMGPTFQLLNAIWPSSAAVSTNIGVIILRRELSKTCNHVSIVKPK
jgi:hypothetical protein